MSWARIELTDCDQQKMLRRSHENFRRSLHGSVKSIRSGFLVQSQSRHGNQSVISSIDTDDLNAPRLSTFDFARPENYKTSAELPIVKTIEIGKELLHNASHNKGLAFTFQERRHYHLHGLLPPVYCSLDTQAKQIMNNINRMKDPLDQHMFLMNILDTSRKLFYRVLCENLPTLMPIGKCVHYDMHIEKG